MTIETKKVANANEAIEIINRLNYRHDTFCYEQTTREDNADIKYRHFCSYRANGEKDGFAMLEIVVNGKLEVVRFYNLFRDITVELRLGNFTPNYGRYNEIINVDETTAEDNAKAEVKAEVEDSTKTTITNAATENKITVESARANGLSLEEFFAANAGLTVEEYRAREEENARKAEETAKAYALQAKIDTCKSTINFYDEKSRHAAWYLYNAVIKGDEDQATYIANDIAEFENKIAEAKKELADLEPATEAAEDSVEAKVEDDNDNSSSIKTKKARKLYRMNPVYKKDENPRYNVVDIFIENGVLKINGLFECKNIETAYKRFVKCMTQAANEVTELEGWDNWEAAQKLTLDENGECYVNENGEAILTTFKTACEMNDCRFQLIVDVAEDFFYIYGTFDLATEAENTNAQVEETDDTEVKAETDDTDNELIDAAEDNVEEYAITPEAMDVAIAGEYSNCARASLLAFAAMIPAVNTELKRVCADEIKAHYYAEKVASESKPLDESFSANVMPAEDDDTEDELIDAPDRRTVERNKGNYGEFINGEYVRFENHSIVYIDADRKRGFHFCKVNGKKFFYRQCGHKIAAAKIIEAYMLGEIADAQNKAHHEFFYAHKLEVGKHFKVSFEITTADGQEHFFSRTFDTFAEAKALVDEFTSTFSEPTLIVIAQNKQGGDWYYSRGVDGTEKFFDAYCKMKSAAEDKVEEKNFTANCYYTYTKDDGEWNGSQSKNFATATEAANWIINLVRDNGYTLTDGNIRDWNTHKRYFLTETDFNAVNAQTKVTAAEVEPEKKSTAKVDRLDELKGSKLLIYKAINNALRDHYVKLESGEFYDASDAGFTTIGFDADRPEFEKLYFKDDSGAYVEVSDKALDAFNRLEVELRYTYKAIDAEIARTAVKFEVGKWYASDETDWNGNPCGTYRVLKRTKKFVTIYDPDIDDWNDIDNYDPDDEIDGEFDCIFRKKIQYDERGEYVDWRDDDGELVTLCAKDETNKPVDDDDPDDDEDDADNDDAAEDNAEVESVNDEKPEHTTVDELNQPPTAEELYKMFAKTIVNANAMNVTLQNGRKIWGTRFEGAYVEPEYYYKHWFIKDNLGFLFARYDTPEQVETVINMLKAAIERGDKEFTFPTVDELNQPSKEDLRDSLKRAAEIAQQKYHEYERDNDEDGMLREIELYSICTDAIKELEVA